MDKQIDQSKTIRRRLSYTILITVGATYVLTLLVVGLLMNITTVSMAAAQTIRLVIAVIIGFATWNILKENEQTEDDQK